MKLWSIVAIGLLAGCQGSGATPKLSLPEKAPPASVIATGNPAGSLVSSAGAAADTEVASVLTGTTAARRISQVSASGSGLLVALKVREGEYVKAGQVIAQLDRRDARLRATSAEAGLKLARVQLVGAEREVARLEKLAQAQAVPAADLDRLRTARDAAAAGVENAEAALAMVRKMDSDADVRAPFDGLVTMRMKAEGEWISTMPPAPLIALAEVTPLDLKVDLPAALLPKVKVGDTLSVRLVAIGRDLTAPITRIVPTVQPQTRTFPVFAEIPNEDRSLAPGLFAEVRLGGDAARAQANAAPPSASPASRPAGGAETP